MLIFTELISSEVRLFVNHNVLLPFYKGGISYMPPLSKGDRGEVTAQEKKRAQPHTVGGVAEPVHIRVCVLRLLSQ